ncbi:MAG: glucosylceramidase [Bacteroidales bacterium]|nr:glucosylceramidase [Bacteroidales bacterium]
MKRLAPLLTLILAAALSACGGGSFRLPDGSRADALQFTTTADRLQLFAESGLSFRRGEPEGPVIRAGAESYQTVEGFGAAVTVSSCYNLLKMPAEARAAFLREMFSPTDGVGSSLIRICIGGSDFSWDYAHPSGGRFTWCDEPGMEHFAPHELDVRYVLPVLKEIFAINPDVRIIGSPWTAPPWMKLDLALEEPYESWTGGRLNPACYQDYADYFVRWIRYFEAQGFPIYAVTPQNEPLSGGNSMSMVMYWQDCRDFVKTALGPALEAAGLKTKILIFDHNYNYDRVEGQLQYPLQVYADPEASKYIAGSAWHDYGGDVSELDRINAAAPDKEVWFTEASIGTWNYRFERSLLRDYRNIFLGTLSRGGKGVVLWNLMLDEKKGPYTNFKGSCMTCYGAANVTSYAYADVEKYTHWYNIAHASRVIRPGAVRISTEGAVEGLECLFFRNPDKTLGALLLNATDAPLRPTLSAGRHNLPVEVPARALVSVLWKE